MTRSEAGRKGAVALQNRLIKEYNEHPNFCKLCGKKIELVDGMTPGKARSRKFCSPECKNKNQSNIMAGNTIWKWNEFYGNYQKIRNDRPCIVCGNPLGKNAKKFCSTKCERDFLYNEYIKKWKAGEKDGIRCEYQISDHIKHYIHDKYENKCCKCGWHEINPYTNKTPLEIHHKDGDYKNNKEDNLELLCPNCHSLTATYKNSNKNGRKARKKYT